MCKQMWGAWLGCKMATDDGVLLGGVEWSSSPVTFHRNKEENVELTESNTVATRTEGYSGVVFTSEPMIVGQMLKVTVTERVEGHWLSGGMVRAHLVCAVFTKYATPSILGNFLTSKNSDCCVDNYFSCHILNRGQTIALNPECWKHLSRLASRVRKSNYNL